MRRTVLHLLVSCAAAAALVAAHVAPADAYEPRPDYNTAIGVVWDGSLPYALTFTAAGELGDTAWNITDNMSRLYPNPYTVDDAEWGNRMGYTYMYLDGERYGIVAVAGGLPPVLVGIGEAEPYMGDGVVVNRDGGATGPWSYLQVSVDSGLLVVQQSHGYDREYNGTLYHFHGADEPPVEVQGELSPNLVGDYTMIVVNVNGRNHAVVNMVDSPPVLADVMEAAALGLGDISGTTPISYVQLDAPPTLQAVQIDTGAEIRTMDVGTDRTWAAVNYGGQVHIYEITDPHDIVRANLHHTENATQLWEEYDRVLGTGAGIVHAVLEHPGRAGYDIPKRLNVVQDFPRLDAAGTWAVTVSPGGGISVMEADPNTAVSVAYADGRTYAAERDAGWSGGEHDIRTYDATDPANVVRANHTHYGMWGEPGRAAIISADNNMTWALVSVRDDYVEGPVMEITDFNVRTGGINADVEVRNIHHEPITVRIDRLKVSNVVMEVAHPYSSFESPGYGAVRISGPTVGGYYGPTQAYLGQDIPYKRPLGNGVYDHGTHWDTHVIYSNEKYGRVFAYVQDTGSIRLEPGESKSIGATIHVPCGSEPRIKLPNACGLGGASLALGWISGGDPYFDYDVLAYIYPDAELTLVVDNHPEWTETVGSGRYG